MTTPVPELQHRTVLLQAAVDALAITAEPARRNGVYVDGTFGRGGHSRAMLAQLGPAGRLVAFDKDPAAIAAGQGLVTGEGGRFVLVHDSFAALDVELARRGLKQVQGVLLDLGISSPQIDEAARGFSFRQDGPLDMRMDNTRGLSAAQWLAVATVPELTEVLRVYGEERFAVQIAQAIVARRAEQPLLRTRQLAQLVADVIGARRSRKDAAQDPATRTFQAVRIFINQELAELEQGLRAAMNALAPGGRLAVISFHSLEDRLVKRFLQDGAHPAQPPAGLPVKAVDLPRPRLRLVARIMPDATEIAANPRARSAVLRVAEKLEAA